jgi:hypothetical protein
MSVDLTIHVDEDTIMAVDFVDDLAELTIAKGSSVALSGTPVVTIRDAQGDIVLTWASPAPQINGTRIDYRLAPSSGSQGEFDLIVECDNDSQTGAHVVATRRDGRVTRLVKVEVLL